MNVLCFFVTLTNSPESVPEVAFLVVFVCFQCKMLSSLSHNFCYID